MGKLLLADGGSTFFSKLYFSGLLWKPFHSLRMVKKDNGMKDTFPRQKVQTWE